MSRGVAVHWRLIPQRYNLVGTECKNCGEKFFPLRQLCPNCRRSGDVREVKYSGEGEIYSYTIVHTPSEGFEFMKPYVIGVIKLVEGPFITAQIVDCKPEDLEIGKKVELVFRKVIADGSNGIIRYGYKFKLKE
ncbi:MAG: Zn-ribbon domain-containing OB-fold protein [Candidatus Altiarchaeota archaeon]|nr:Zn-ribbon domain-containing OB-fold protein [Candidatus Altiarchaeota archaeon]